MAADSWSDVSRQGLAILNGAPPWIIFASLLATQLGVFVLVSEVGVWSAPAGHARIPKRQLRLELVSKYKILTCDAQFFVLLSLAAPVPREPLPEEKKYRTLNKDGNAASPQQLPCWFDTLKAQKLNDPSAKPAIEAAELHMSVVVPAFNEEERLTEMLEEAVNYLERTYGDASEETTVETRSTRQRKTDSAQAKNGHATASGADRGWEIVIVSDGSTDRTEEVAFRFAKERKLEPGTFRVVRLTRNRGKGGAVTHGMRHVRGQYVVFADADGASKFEDLGKLVAACSKIEDSRGRGVAVGSRAHMVGSEAVVKVSGSIPKFETEN